LRPPHVTLFPYPTLFRFLAEQGAGLTSPGAMVGAVIVKDGTVIGEGFYMWDGIRHAEIIALEQAGAAARGATLYTSLEPCSHRGDRKSTRLNSSHEGHSY